ncbi:peptidoglycan-binding domain-containing protein [Rhodobium gokarnense]|uniref:Peptidoglycan binding-like domain-containing protein n=1 Tax=Rhodobium gokarnense TaxID=364296 RepID=A0ABT3HCC6_9HYPH|nr:peptidoglycan-binding domain-containing protein [Rhodobium gokarnense]MCW2307999.1 hypothetical protein [Rhodobium gokarnense]
MAIDHATAGSLNASSVQTGTLLPNQPVSMPIEPLGLEVAGAQIFVMGNDAGTDSTVMRFASEDLEKPARVDLDFTAFDIALSETGDVLFVVGIQEGKPVLESLSSDLKRLGKLTLDDDLVWPTLSYSATEQLIIADLKSNKKGLLFVDIANPKNLRHAPRLFFDTSIGISEVWWDPTSEVMFANAAQSPMLITVDTSQKRASGFLAWRSTSENPSPLAVHGWTGAHSCRKGASSSFVIAASLTGYLALVDYEPISQSLDTLSVVPGVGKKVENRFYEHTDIIRPANLIASSCDQSVIWLGYQSRPEIVQFSRAQNSTTLDKIGEIRLPFVPTDIAIDPSGAFAVAISRERRLIVRYDRRGENDGTGITGDPEIRKIQRLLSERGYPVGYIDGIAGPRTYKAASEFAKNKEKNAGKIHDLNSLKSLFAFQ